ncbi:MAG: hypothetical protein ACR2P1_13510 [Pseudomonadales bacterium]
MTTLVIKDLAANEELDSNAMADVKGGMRHRGSFAPAILDGSQATGTDNLPTPHQHNLGDLSAVLTGYDL